MADLTLDDALDLEDKLYEKGFEEGNKAAANEQYFEGKAYGLQTGFQRFLIVGYLDGLLHDWRQQETSTQIENHLRQLEDILSKIDYGNSNQSVAAYEKAVFAARNKVRVIASITKTTAKVACLDKLVEEVGGTLAVATNLDEMW